MKDKAPLAVLTAGFIHGALIVTLVPLVSKLGIIGAICVYLAWVVAAGALASLHSPRHFWIAPFALCAGQIACLCFFYWSDRFLGFPVGIAAGSFPVAFVGAGLTYWRWKLKRRSRSE